MKNLRKMFLGIGIALASISLVFGGFSLSLAEGNITTVPASVTQTPTLTYSPTLQPFTPSAYSPTPSPTMTPTWTPSLPPLPTNCTPPMGWVPYVVQPGDTLDNIAALYRISGSELQKANCLQTTGLLPGVIIYVPPASTQTPVRTFTKTPWACGRPPGWVPYIVQPGDTLYHLSLIYGVSVAQLQQANCIANPNDLRVGQVLYVPYVIMPTPWPTIGPIIPTLTPTITLEPGLPSDTPFPTEPPIPTETPFPTDTPVPTDIPTATEPPVTP
jgi:LysM repeat protein